MSVSVVIASYNRSGELRACLESLARQRFQPGDEVVVADNGSTDDTQEVLRQVSAHFPVPLLTVFEAKPGKTHAVNRALGSCHGDIIAFTDDDVLVGEDWIERIQEVFADGHVDLAGGRVLPNFAAPVPAWLDLSGGDGFGRLASPLGLADYGATRQPLGSRSALGGNMVVRRAAMEAVGGFPRDLGKLRGTLLSGEDHALSERMVGSGYEAIYDPAILVHHLVPASRLRLGYFIRWFFWSGLTHAALDAARQRPNSSLRRLTFYHLRQGVGALGRAAGWAMRRRWPEAAKETTHAAFSTGYVWAHWKPGSRPWMAAANHRVEAA